MKEILCEKPKIEIWLGDCLELMKEIPDKSVDLVLTDPPYPDYYKEKYQYKNNMLNFLKNYNCRQFIFWSAKVDFPLDYTAIHIWDKKCGCGSEYERIFERNGQKNYKFFRAYLINSTVAAKYTKDEYTGHPSQKPISLIRELINKYTKENDLIFDPFMGSGTTGVACKELGRNFIGIEIEPKYCEMAQKRVDNTAMRNTLI